MRNWWLACVPAVLAGLVWWTFGQAPREVTAAVQRRVPPLVATDSSGNGHDGVLQGDVKTGLPGHDGGGAFSFTARDAWIQVASSPGLNPEQEDFLLSAWVNLTTEPGTDETYDIVRKGLGYTYPGEFKMEVLDGGKVRCSAKDDKRLLAVVTSKVGGLADGTWHHVGCARVGDQWGVLVDDETVTRTYGLGSLTNTVAMAIGGKYGYEDRPEGRLDDVRLYVGAPAADGTDFDEAVSALQQGDPEAWWRFDEAADSTER